MSHQFLVLTFEVAFAITPRTRQEITSTLNELRGQAVAKAVSSRLITGDGDFDKWHKTPGIHSVEVPMPQVITFD